MLDRRRVARSCLAATLTLSLSLLPAVPAAAEQAVARPAALSAPNRSSRAPLTSDERIGHALDRLTFGPRPGDVAAVKAMGFDHWFEQQLNPSSIDDSALDRRLDAFPAMRLSQAQLVARFPDRQLIRAASKGNLPLPADPDLRAVYRHSIALYQQKQAEKETGKPDTSDASIEATAQAGKVAFDVVSAMGRPRRVNLLGPTDLLSTTFNLKGKATVADPGINDPALPGQRGRSFHAEALYPEAATSALLALPPADRVSRLLALSPADLVALRHSLSSDELQRLSTGLSPAQKETLAELGNPASVVTAELLASRLERDLFSARQLEAVMTDFWLNHFNVFIGKGAAEPLLLPAFERDAIRPHALGHFENLLVATAASPAMLVYLDNAQSVGPHSEAAERAARTPKAAKGASRGLNENYARELMELHTLGVRCEASKDHTPADPTCGAGYTQTDVTEVARVLSGWTVDRPALGGLATYDERRHDPGSKHVLGATIEPNGEREGLELLHRLATSPATARFISTQLAVRFVADDPPDSLIDRMTKSWLASNGDISVVLRTMVYSPEFFAPAAYQAKVKTPLEFVVSAVRASDAEVTNPAALVQSLNRLGMPLYGMPTPNGYSWLAEPWVSTSALLTRMNFALALADNRLPGTRVCWPAFSASIAPSRSAAAGDPAIAERTLERTLLSTRISDRTRAILLAQLAGDAATPSLTPASAAEVAADRRLATAAGLLLGSPEFQRR